MAGSENRIRASFVKPLGRRALLRGLGVALALPWLDAMSSRRARGTGESAAGTGAPPRRMLAICNNLGLMPEYFFPAEEGPEYAATPYLKFLESRRTDLTVMSGLSHPGVDGAHASENCFLTAAPGPGRGGFRNSISLDQVASQHIGHLTRFPFLALGVNTGGTRSLSWTSSGAPLPCDESASAVFSRLFLRGDDRETRAAIQRLRMGGSVLDAAADHAKSLRGKVGVQDRRRLDQYFASVREVEQRIAQAIAWESRPKPVVSVAPPVDPPSPRDFLERTRLMYDIVRLAFETDSTRVATIFLAGTTTPALNLEGISDGYHNLSHHNRNEKKIAQLRTIEEWHMKLLEQLLTGLAESWEQDERLLDRAMVLYGSNLGNASTHSTTNLPLLLAGGGFKHGQHLRFDPTNNAPAPNLFVGMLQRLGIETDRFASSTGTLTGLEPVE